MRIVFLVFVTAFAGVAVAAEAAPVGARSRAIETVATQSSTVESVCYGCGCRGGPGYRLPNGKCASRR